MANNIEDDVSAHDPNAFRPSEDEITDYRRLRQGAGAGASSVFFNALLMIIIIAAIAGGGWLYYQQYLQVSTILADLPELQGRLDMVSTSDEASEDAINSSIGQISATLAATQKSLNAVKQQLQKNNGALTERKQDVDHLSLKIKQVETKNKAYDGALLEQKTLLERIEVLEAASARLTDTGQSLADNLNSVTRQQAALKKDLKDMKEAIRTIDRHRQLLDRRMLEIRSGRAGKN